MTIKPTYAELESTVAVLKRELAVLKKPDNTLTRILSEDFKQLADRSPDAIYQFDIESRTFSFFNRQFLSLYAVEENGVKILSPKSVILHIHPADRHKVKSARALSWQKFRTLPNMPAKTTWTAIRFSTSMGRLQNHRAGKPVPSNRSVSTVPAA